jgi:hypothetical protein
MVFFISPIATRRRKNRDLMMGVVAAFASLDKVARLSNQKSPFG